MAGETNVAAHWDASTGWTVPAGWTCPRCSTWVANGTTHTCWAYGPQPVSPSPWYVSLTDADVDRIARRIVELMRVAEVDPDAT